MRKNFLYNTIIALKSRTVAKNSPALVLFISVEQLLALNVCRYLGDIGNIDLAVVVDIAFDTTAIGRYTECVFDKICTYLTCRWVVTSYGSFCFFAIYSAGNKFFAIFRELRIVFDKTKIDTV